MACTSIVSNVSVLTVANDTVQMQGSWDFIDTADGVSGNGVASWSWVRNDSDAQMRAKVAAAVKAAVLAAFGKTCDTVVMQAWTQV